VYIEAADSRDARRFAGNVMLWAGVAGLVIWMALITFADLTVTIAGPGLSASAHQEAVGLLHILAPLAFVSGITAILYTVCQAESRFGAMAMSTIAAPVVTLVTMLALWARLGIDALAVGSLLGAIASLLVLVLASIRASILPIPIPRRDPRLGPFLRHAAPITLGTAVLQLNVVGDRAIATLLGPGAVSTLRYAEVLVRTPISAIGPAWGLAIYPALVRAAVGIVSTTLASAVERTLGYVIAVFVPIAALTAAVAPLATSIAYERGAFGPDQVLLTAESVAGFAPLLVVLMMLTVITSAHNARKRGTLLMVGGILNVILNLTLDVLLGISLGVPGIALATSISQGAVMFLFLVRLTGPEDNVKVRPLMRTLALALLSSAPTCLVISALVWGGLVPANILFAVLLLGVLGLLGLFGYLLTATRAGLEEPRAIAMLITRRLIRRGPVAQGE
jgi:putative peptidoglycan lipid II flippase